MVGTRGSSNGAAEQDGGSFGSGSMERMYAAGVPASASASSKRQRRGQRSVTSGARRSLASGAPASSGTHGVTSDLSERTVRAAGLALLVPSSWAVGRTEAVQARPGGKPSTVRASWQSGPLAGGDGVTSAVGGRGWGEVNVMCLVQGGSGVTSEGDVVKQLRAFFRSQMQKSRARPAGSGSGGAAVASLLPEGAEAYRLERQGVPVVAVSAVGGFARAGAHAGVVGYVVTVSFAAEDPETESSADRWGWQVSREVLGSLRGSDE